MYKPKQKKIISFIQDQKFVGQCCLACLDHITNVEIEIVSIDFIHVVLQFRELFPIVFPSMPSNRDIGFCIDLVRGTHPFLSLHIAWLQKN